MAVVGLRDLSRNTRNVVEELEKTGEPVLVTRQGRPVAALIAVDQRRAENLALAATADFAGSTLDADEALARNEVRSLSDALAEIDERETEQPSLVPSEEPDEHEAVVALDLPHWEGFLTRLSRDVVAQLAGAAAGPAILQQVANLNAELLATYVDEAVQRVRLMNRNLISQVGGQLDLDDYSLALRTYTMTERSVFKTEAEAGHEGAVGSTKASGETGGGTILGGPVAGA